MPPRHVRPFPRRIRPAPPAPPARPARRTRFPWPPDTLVAVPRDLSEVLAAIDAFSPELPWEEVAPSVLPVFERAVPPPFPPEALDQVHVVLPPGVSVGFGVDTGPAVMRITRALLERWDQTPDALAVRAVFNLRARGATADPAHLLRAPVEGLPVTAYQSGDGWASALLLVPDLLGRLFGHHPQLFGAPMRDLLLSVPLGSDREAFAWLVGELSAIDPNGLALEAFALEDGVLRCEPLGSRAARA